MNVPAWMRRIAPLVITLAALALLAAGCSKPAPAPARVAKTWIAGHAEPAFDPEGPPDALRFALERLLSRGLLDRDSSGAVIGAAAERWDYAPDSLTLTFHLRADLRFTDGTVARAEDFRAALLAGLGRGDHATRAWLLRSVRGVDAVRAGRPLPAIGIEAADARTLVIHLAARDPELLVRLASPAAGAPFRTRTGDWAQAVGLGPFRIARHDAGRALTLVRAESCAVARALTDTLRVRFLIGAPRVRTVLRAGAADLVWPLPPALLTEPLPGGFTLQQLAASPPRRLMLVMRTDLPPTSKLAARAALAHGIDRRELLDALGARGRAQSGWLEGGGAFDFPSLDAAQSRQWRQRGDLGASFHVVLGYDSDGAGAEVARALQGEWAALGLYAELEPWRGAPARARPLVPAGPHVALLESQPLVPGAAAELATLVLPLRGPAVGAFRTGWRTREFDRWIAGVNAPEPLDAAGAQSRLVEDMPALPLADLPWVWVAGPAGTGASSHPGFGPEYAAPSVTPNSQVKR